LQRACPLEREREREKERARERESERKREREKEREREKRKRKKRDRERARGRERERREGGREIYQKVTPLMSLFFLFFLFFSLLKKKKREKRKKEKKEKKVTPLMETPGHRRKRIADRRSVCTYKLLIKLWRLEWLLSAAIWVSSAYPPKAFKGFTGGTS